MKFICPLIVVNNMGASRSFYEKVLNQNVQFDFGENVLFESGFAIHLKSHFSDLINTGENDIIEKSNNFELYFEEEDWKVSSKSWKILDSGIRARIKRADLGTESH